MTVRLSRADLALAGVAVATWLLMRGMTICADVSWQMWTARQMIGGARMYADLWDINPPLWFWSAIPVQWLAELSGTGWHGWLVATVVAMGAVSAMLTGRLAVLAKPGQQLWLQLMVFAVVVILPWADMGERDQLALITSIPYAFLIARRRAGLSVSTLLAVGTGFFAAYGFALKHFFVPVPIMLEVWFLVGLGRKWRPWRPELFALAGLALAYGAAVLMLAPEFLRDMVPMASLSYGAYAKPLKEMLSPPWVYGWVLGGVYALSVRSRLRQDIGRDGALAVDALLLVFVCFVFSYVAQQKGWNYHSTPATGTLAVSLVVILLGLGRRAALIVFALLAIRAYDAVQIVQLAPPRTILVTALDPGDSLFVVSSDAGMAWPAVEEQGLVWASRTYSLWMLPAIIDHEAGGEQEAEARRIGEVIRTTASHDIRCYAPTLILMDLPEVAGAPGLREYLLRDAALREFVGKHYREQSPGAYLRIAGPVPPPPSGCRKIR